MLIETIYYSHSAVMEMAVKDGAIILYFQIHSVFILFVLYGNGIDAIINDAQSLDCRFLRPKILCEQCGEDEIKEAFGFHSDELWNFLIDISLFANLRKQFRVAK